MKHTLKYNTVFSDGKLSVPGEEVDLPKAELIELGELEPETEEKPAARKPAAKE